MGIVNYGNQTITVDFYAPVNSAVVNRKDFNTKPKGIYIGGYLTRINDTTAQLSALVCEIGDGTYQIRVETTTTVNITVSTTNIYIVLRWAYTGAVGNYMDVLAVPLAGIQANDIVVGKCDYVGSTLQSTFDYSDRTNPNVMDLFLKVEPTETPSMYLRVRAGKANYSSANFDVDDQLTSIFTAPESGTRIDLIQINTSGAIIITQGTVGAGVPDYNGLITIAEVTINAGQTSITASSIKDVRGFIANSTLVSTVIQKIYPVGALYVSTLSTNPATLLGFGTWVAFGAGRVPVGYNAADSDFNASEKVGGSKTIDTRHRHIVTGNDVAGSGRVSLNDKTVYTDYQGNASQSVMNPFIVVYMWKRTA